MRSNRNIIIIVIVLLVLVAGVLWTLRSKKIQKQADDEIIRASQVEKVNVDFTKLPEKFPASVPIESGAKITQNYNSTTPNGHFQATRTFETKQTLDVNFNLYKDYLQKAGWKIESTTNDPEYKMILGSKGAENIQVDIGENSKTKIKTVSISYTLAR